MQQLMHIAAKSVFIGVACAIAIHQFLVVDQSHVEILSHPSLVHAFSGDGWSSSRQRRRTSTLLTSSSSLSARSIYYPAFQPRKSLSSLEVPCRNAILKAGTRYDDCSSLLVCRSTVSDETETEVKVNVEETVVKMNGVNGANGANGINGSTNGVNGNDLIAVTNGAVGSNGHPEESLDIPTPTSNGGFTHTSASRAKISAANKGKAAWNKGKARSEETKARIAEGVRRKNRERFLAKLAAEGITEEEYTERKKAERRKKDAERRARRTAKGGYTPTEETKKKISKILKEKYANGEVKRTPRDPSKVRRGFKHTEETKQKIRASLKRKWAEDEEYREMMKSKTVASGKVDSSVRQRISETLKKRWEDPEFREHMMEKFANRRASSGTRDESHRQKISAAMKKKWMDEEYRRRATEGMAKGRESASNKVTLAKPVPPKEKVKAMGAAAIKALTPASAVQVAKKKKSATKKKTTKRKKKASTKQKGTKIEAVKPIKSSDVPAKPKKAKPKPDKPAGDGCISRMREERRDLYDLLYGDEEDSHGDGGSGSNGDQGRPVTGEPPAMLSSSTMAGRSSSSMAALLAEDDDLDDFDPYGLQ